MTRRPPIEGRVARILNLRELAINRGASDGVNEGMIFDILDPKAEDITDPETGEILGSVYRPKVQVSVFAVEDRLALARTFKSDRVNLGGTGLGGLARAFEPPKWVERHETLKTNESTWQDLDESESIVKTGDPVVQALMVAGLAEAAGSRTLEHPEVENQLVLALHQWLTKQGWTVEKPTGGGRRWVDLVASRGDELLVAEAKARRGPISSGDVAQALGWLTLYPRREGKSTRQVLVIGEAGLAPEAAELLRSHSPTVGVYRVVGTDVETVELQRVLPAGDSQERVVEQERVTE